MKKCKNLLMTIVALLTLVGEISVIPANLQNSSYRKKEGVSNMTGLKLLVISDQKYFM